MLGRDCFDSGAFTQLKPDIEYIKSVLARIRSSGKSQWGAYHPPSVANSYTERSKQLHSLAYPGGGFTRSGKRLGQRRAASRALASLKTNLQKAALRQRIELPTHWRRDPP